ncbi:hypothetical protein QR680_002626 [Steinernema hermaphroditum]|uniref:Phosphatidylinositol N-acetylglucosaminyltransferase subunit Q n=1 Tax=Steinernema hermaphroditum TaxID=289476 RepID=A0AA39LIP9_9BILA|nr:hypothetical protein QR680_002626 [Steinernema hermaphroditum]
MGGWPSCTPLTYVQLKRKFEHGRWTVWFVDSLLGVASVYLLLLVPADVWVWTGLQHMIQLLEGTIGWIRKNPVGLKMNHHVSESLAQFFSYHIFLWQTFVSAVYSKCVITAFRFSGILGVSTLIASVIDVVNLFTLHILCFHIYASRLAVLSFKALISLLRFFCGVKYNPLRKRVDSVSLDSRQLFLATLFLTILIFLLPTIGVYFLVFSTLHYAVYCLRFLLHSTLDGVNAVLTY